MNPIKQAEATQAELAKRLTTSREALKANIARRDDLAFEAQTGDAEARKETARLATEASALADDIASLEAAAKEAARRVTAAKEAAAKQVEREKAAKSRVITARLATRGAAMDAGLSAFKAAYSGLIDDMRELALLGAPAPSANLIDVNLRRALDSGLGGLHAKVRPVPPLQRHSFDELAGGWARPSERWAAGILDADKGIERGVKKASA